MMKTFSQHRSVNDPTRASPTTAHFTFWGAVIGAVAGLATLFAVSTYYGATSGLGAMDCVAFGSVSTLLLSQPAVLAGLAVGAVCGGACALVVHQVHRSQSSG